MTSPWKTVVVGCLTVGALNIGAPRVHAVSMVQSDSVISAPKRVILILHDENKDELPGLARTDRSLRNSFHAALGDGVEIHSESMGLSRSAQPGFETRLADFYRTKYASLKPDLIVAVMDPALEFLLRHARTIFPGVPIVFASIDPAVIKNKTLPDNITGVAMKRAYSPTLEVALRLQPDTRHVFIVGGSSPFDQSAQSPVRRDFQPFENRVSITYLFGLSMDELLSRVSNLPAHSIIIHISMLRDGAGNQFVPANALATIAAKANAPVYVFLDQYVGLGAVGGNVVSFVTHGAQVAALGLAILDGASPASLPIRVLDAQVNMFDVRQLKRWHLDQGRLPRGSELRNQDRSLWMLYRWYIIAAIGLLLIQGTLIGGLLLTRARQRRAELEALRLRDDLAHVQRVNTLGELTSSLAHEISQPLTAIMANAQAASRLMKAGRAANETLVTEALADITADARHTSRVIDRLRALFRKKPVEHVPVDMKALVDDAVRLLRAAMLFEDIEVRLVRGESAPLVTGDAVQLEQVVLNVLVNASEAIGAADGGPRLITIRMIERRPRWVTIEVTDTGIGVSGDRVEQIFGYFVSSKTNGLGVGLAISRSIINAHGGRIWATRNTERGLTVHIELPTSAPAAATKLAGAGMAQASS